MFNQAEKEYIRQKELKSLFSNDRYKKETLCWCAMYLNYCLNLPQSEDHINARRYLNDND